VSAILITLAIILPCLLVGFLSPAVARTLVMVAVISTSLWVALDSSRPQVRDYKSQVGPIHSFCSRLRSGILHS